MKKGLLISAIASFILIGCGGGDNNNTSTQPVKTSPKTYLGAATVGDFAKVTFDGVNLKYDINGIKLVQKSGTVKITKNLNNFVYQDSDGRYYLASGGIMFSKVDDVPVFTLNNTTTNASDFAGKKYNLIVITNDSVSLKKLTINDNKTWSFDSGENGTWLFKDDHIIVKSDGKEIANIIINKANGHTALVVDFIYGDVAIGAEASAIETTNDTFNTAWLSDNNGCYGNIKVNGDKFTQHEEQCTDGDPDPDITGNLTLNPTIDGTKYNGLFKYNVPGYGAEGYGFYDKANGLFVSVAISGAYTGTITAGSNKPFQ